MTIWSGWRGLVTSNNICLTKEDYNHVWHSGWRKGIIPLHATAAGSGSHSPFSMHVVALGPVSTSPGGHVNVIVFPNSRGST